MINYNNRDILIEGISNRLMQAYANELVALMTGWYDGSKFYNGMREGLHKDLRRLMEDTFRAGIE